MPGKVLVLNTHTGPNPDFLHPLQRFIDKHGLKSTLISGHARKDPQNYQGFKIILSGVPLSADYSLSTPATKAQISDHYGWIKNWQGPVLGICYGHQILAHLFGGEVQPLEKRVVDRQYPLKIDHNPDQGSIFSGLNTIHVFAEHRDYVSRIPENFEVLAQKGNVPYILYEPNRNFYGMQFVPERSGPKTQKALLRFLRLNQE